MKKLKMTPPQWLVDEREFIDLTAPKVVEITISEQGDRVWICAIDDRGCLIRFRACRIGTLLIEDQHAT